MEGAEWNVDSNRIKINNEVTNPLPTLKFTWVKYKNLRNHLEENELFVPVYLNKSRNILLFSVKIDSGNLTKTLLYQKGLSFLAWN